MDGSTSAGSLRGRYPDTLRRAKKALGVRSHQVHGDDGTREWYWSDPAAPWPDDAPFPKPFELAPLPPLW